MILKETKIVEDKDGNSYMFDNKGLKRNIEYNANNKPFYRDENNNIVFVN